MSLSCSRIANEDDISTLLEEIKFFQCRDSFSTILRQIILYQILKPLLCGKSREPERSHLAIHPPFIKFCLKRKHQEFLQAIIIWRIFLHIAVYSAQPQLPA